MAITPLLSAVRKTMRGAMPSSANTRSTRAWSQIGGGATIATSCNAASGTGPSGKVSWSGTTTYGSSNSLVC